MIEYKDIEHSRGRASLELVVEDPLSANDLRPFIWDRLYRQVQWQIATAAMEIVANHPTIELSMEFPGLPKALEPVVKMLTLKGKCE